MTEFEQQALALISEILKQLDDIKKIFNQPEITDGELIKTIDKTVYDLQVKNVEIENAEQIKQLEFKIELAEKHLRG